MNIEPGIKGLWMLRKEKAPTIGIVSALLECGPTWA